MASKKAWTGRFLCWDDALLAEKQGVSVRMHKPQKKNIALACDSEWEGSHNGYGSIVRLGDVYRLYYRACPFSLPVEGKPLAGYQSYEMFGDATHRPVAFEKPLSALRGKRVALRFALRDADLYSFCFV